MGFPERLTSLSVDEGNALVGHLLSGADEQRQHPERQPQRLQIHARRYPACADYKAHERENQQNEIDADHFFSAAFFTLSSAFLAAVSTASRFPVVGCAGVAGIPARFAFGSVSGLRVPHTAVSG